MKKILRLKHVFLYPYNVIKYSIINRNKYSITNNDDLFSKIINQKKSIVRYGDGEMSIMDFDSKIGFQSYDGELSKRLKEIWKRNNPNILVETATLNNLKYLTFQAKFFWLYNVNKNIKLWKKYFPIKDIYFDSLVTRPYMIEKIRIL